MFFMARYEHKLVLKGCNSLSSTSYDSVNAPATEQLSEEITHLQLELQLITINNKQQQHQKNGQMIFISCPIVLDKTRCFWRN